MQQPPWRNRAQLSSFPKAADSFLNQQGLDKGPWIAVFFAAGIAFWFATPGPDYWVAGLLPGLLGGIGACLFWRRLGTLRPLMLCLLVVSLAVALGISTIWARSASIGQPAIARPVTASFTARILERIEQPAQNRVRLIVATRLPGSESAVKLRLNVPLNTDDPRLTEGAVVRLKARLMPPGPPVLPGGYDFARAAWFQGIAATGTVSGPITILRGAAHNSLISNAQRKLSAHVNAQVGGQAGAIAAAFASGDRGSISPYNEVIMRDSGLTHLLSVSGVHVSAVIAAGYVVALKLLGLWPWLVLRVRLPVLAAGAGAAIGIGYTLVTGMEVPTVRSCVAALLVLAALVLGRQPLSMRMLAVAAGCILLVLPEALSGPSFQMSFTAVLAIVALHTSAPVRAFLAPRDESGITRIARRCAMLFATGVVIELALMPIVMFHFHRAGIYGSLANMAAIPLVSIVTLPGIGLALLLDIIGLGAPLWWIVGRSLNLLLWIAEITANQPGAVNLMPQISRGNLAFFVAGSLVLAMAKGQVRWLGLVPIVAAAFFMLRTPVPDVLITGDGVHVAVHHQDGNLYLLRKGRSSYIRDNLTEMTAYAGAVKMLEDADFARCSPDFCVLNLSHQEKQWILLLSRSDNRVPLEALQAACSQSDIVIADRWLPKSCQPRLLKADRKLLNTTGGIALYIAEGRIETVAEWQGEHGWWKRN